MLLRNVVCINAYGTTLKTDTSKIPVRAPILKLSKEIDQTWINPGETLTYTIAYTNVGSGIATGLVLTDTPPHGVTAVGAPGLHSLSIDYLTWDVGHLESGQSGRIALSLTVPLTHCWPLINAAEMRSEQGNWTSATVTAQTTCDYFMPIAYQDFYSVAEIPICNGDFETGDFGCWSEKGELHRFIQPDVVHTGRYAAELGNHRYACQDGVPKLDAWIRQSVHIPNECPSPTLSFWYRIRSNDILVSSRYDSFDVYVNKDLILRAGNKKWSKPACSALWDSQWRQHTWDLSQYRGKTIELSFGNVIRADWWYNTYTYLDDVEVLCRPQ
jgi:uncharacterized repeat protein (TIGR01451 family)